MVFSSPIFLFLFLPLVLVAYYLIRPVSALLSNLILLLFSLLFYAWGEPVFMLVMLASIVCNYAFGLWLGRAQSARARQVALTGAVVFNVAVLVVCKYANFVIDNLNGVLHSCGLHSMPWVHIPLPIGISFFTFQAMSYVIDVYRRETPVQRNPLHIALYIALFPQLIAGPIVRYHDIARQIVYRRVTLPSVAGGVQRFIIGLAKKVIIANTLAGVADQVFATPVVALAWGESWLGLLCYALQIYFDFSGYSDMAIGLGHMFGFTFLENFQYPYIASSIREFWRRWHISLSTWFRDYLYIPLGGNQRGAARTYLNLLIVFFLCGLWHGASWTFVVWGLYHGVFLVIERTRVGRVLDALWAPLRHCYVLLVVLIGWCLFRATTLSYAGAFVSVLFGGGAATHGLTQARYYMTPDVLAALGCGALGSMPVLPAAQRLLASWRRPGFANALGDAGLACLSTAYLAVLFAWCAMALASGTYNPFIYFRF